MKFGIAYCLLFSVQACYAQVFTIEKIYMSDSAYVFPIIHSTERPAIAKKMNTAIQEALGADPGMKNPFDSLNNEDEYYFETGAVNERVLSIVVTGSHNGCGHHVSTGIHNFDSRTGAHIDLNQLFRNDGQIKLRKAAYKLWKEVLKANQNAQFAAEEFKTCLVEAEKISEIDINGMLVNDQGMSFWGGYCLDASNSQYDPSSGPHVLSFGQLLPMLTPYGYSLFVNKSTAPFQTLLRGTIDGKYAISLSILSGNAAGTTSGMIVYDRVGQPINISGTVDGTQFMFHELDDAGNALSNIEVTWDGTKLTGSFVNLKSKKQMPFVASAVGGK